MAALIAAALAFAAGESQAQQRIAFAGSAHTATVMVTVGKSEDMHTDQSLVDIAVGDPDVADVNPLTDHALSILGKKIGTTRVTVYGEDKKQVGIFDVEVSYDISRLSAEIARFTGGGIKVSSVNGRIMLSGTAPDAVTLDKAVMIARQFGPDPINTVQVTAAAADHAGGALHRSLAAGEPRARLSVEHVRQQDRRQCRQPGAGLATADHGAGRRVPAAGRQCRRSELTGNFAAVAGHRRRRALRRAPFGFLVSQLVGGKNPLNVAVNALEQKGLARSLAEPNLVALSGDTASFLAGGEFPVPMPGALGTSLHSTTSHTASAFPSRRPCSRTA